MLIYQYTCLYVHIYIYVYIGYSSLPRGKPMLHPTLRSVLGSRKLRSQSQDLGDLDGWINRNRYQESHVQLVGGFNASEKYESIGIIILNICEIKNVPNHQTDSIDTFYIYIYTHVIICLM